MRPHEIRVTTIIKGFEAFPCNNCGDPAPPDVYQKNDGECDDCQVNLGAVRSALERYQLALAAGLQALFALKLDASDVGALFTLAYAYAVADQAEKEASQ